MSLEPINRVINTQDFGCEFHKYVYNALSDIEWIYEDCKDTCDVIFFSGELGYHYILNHIPDIRIPCSFTAYGTRDILSILLQFVIEHPDIPPSRILVDFLTPLNNFMEIKRYLPECYLPYCYEDLMYDYEHITARCESLWNSGKIDIVLTRSINNIRRLEELGIPYLALFPTEQMIAESIEQAVNDLRLSQKAEGDFIIAIVRVMLGSGCGPDEREYRVASLHKLLVDFKRESDLSLSITPGYDRFELQVQRPASPENAALLRALVFTLQQQADFDFRCGCGISRLEDKSHYYAETALLEAMKYDGNDGFLVSGDDGVLTGPLTVSDSLVCNYNNEKAAAFARRVGINETNLIRLVGLFQLEANKLLTAQSLSRLLNVTPRSANRILQQLLEERLVRLAPGRAPIGKGRPVREYLFEGPAFRSTLL